MRERERNIIFPPT